MISQKQLTHQTQKGGTTDYKLNYTEHNIIKQAAFKIMQHHNNQEYHSTKTNKHYYKYQQVLTTLYKTKTTEQLQNIIDRFINQQQKQNNQKLIQHNQNQIIINKLKDLTDQQVAQLATTLQTLEQKYILQLDTDYNNKQSIIQSYQQVLAYKYYKIPLQLKPTQEILIGNLELLEKGASQC